MDRLVADDDSAAALRAIEVAVDLAENTGAELRQSRLSIPVSSAKPK